MIPDMREEFEASREELLVFQTNCLSEYVNYRQPEDAKLSKEGGFLLQHNSVDFEEYSHGYKDIKEMKTKELAIDIWSPYEEQSQHRT
jgi:hypothetical protein